jgi:hypothetical protein
MAWWLAATVRVDVSVFQTSGISQLNSDIFPKQMYLLRASSVKEFGPKQITSVEADGNMARNYESPHSNNENKIKLIIEQKKIPPLYFGKGRRGT